MTPEQLREAILDTQRDFEARHLAAEQAAEQYRTVDATLEYIKLALAEAIAGELDVATSKPKFSNDDRRKAELARRLREPEYVSLVELHSACDHYRRETTAELERAHEALKSYRMMARLLVAQLELEAARAHHTQITQVITPAVAEQSLQFMPMDLTSVCIHP